jgi:hypothetical protein
LVTVPLGRFDRGVLGNVSAGNLSSVSESSPVT